MGPKPLKGLLESRKSKMRYVILLGYSADLKPDELLNQDLNRGVFKDEAAAYAKQNDISDKNVSSRDTKAS